MKHNSKIFIPIVISALLFGGGGFLAGWYLKPKTKLASSTTRAANFGTGGARAGRRGQFGGPRVAGMVISIDGTSMTVKLASGNTQTVYLNNSTTYSKQDDSSVSDIAQGKTVVVTGTAATDGSLTASNVSLTKTTLTPVQN